MEKFLGVTNNPLHVPFVEGSKFLGQCGCIDGLVCFFNVFWGVRAAIRIFITFFSSGHKTIGEIILLYCAANDSDAERTLKSVCQLMRVNDSYVLRDWVDLYCFAQAMWTVESGDIPDKMVIARVIGWLSEDLEAAGIETSVFFNELTNSNDFADAFSDLCKAGF